MRPIAAPRHPVWCLGRSRHLGVPSLHNYSSRKRTLIDGVWTDWSHPRCVWGCGPKPMSPRSGMMTA